MTIQVYCFPFHEQQLNLPNFMAIQMFYENGQSLTQECYDTYPGAISWEVNMVT